MYKRLSSAAPRALASALLAVGLAAGSAAAWAQDKVVYHINNAEAQATAGLRNIRNHLDVAPKTQIVVVTHAEGIDFLRDGAKDKKNPDIDYNALVNALKSRGVRFEICEITLAGAGLKKDQFTMDADFVPSGVARVTQLQTREGYAYLKP
ncbi:DsrE family protein [Ottowia beijingensis]|uniref:DsrE family protein n=1 Tax=Ottowia beijingensis TaxID=1207057 RepID=UPI002FD9FE5E